MDSSNEDNTNESEKATRIRSTVNVIEQMRRRAIELGLDKMTMEEIDAEIKAAREARRTNTES